jgi:heme-degrading monooxygenase HmoA
MLQRVEMDTNVGLVDQLGEDAKPVVLVNTFHVAPDDVDQLLAAWTKDAQILQEKPGFVSTHLHRGIGGSTTFVNYAVWESVDAFREAFADPAFQASFAAYPDSTVASPHLFEKVHVPGVGDDR